MISLFNTIPTAEQTIMTNIHSTNNIIDDLKVQIQQLREDNGRMNSRIASIEQNLIYYVNIIPGILDATRPVTNVIHIYEPMIIAQEDVNHQWFKKKELLHQ